MAAPGQSALAKPRPTPPLYAYHLRWDGQSPRLHVQLNYAPVSADSTVFLFDADQFGGQTDIFQVLEDVQGEAGDRLKRVPQLHKIVVYHTRRGPHQLRYVLNGQITDPPKQLVQRELFRPVIKPGSLYLVSSFFLLQPQHCSPPAISLQFDQFPAKASYFLSVAPNATPATRQVLNPAQATEWLLVLGTDIERHEYRVHGIPYYAITSRRDTLNHMQQELAPFFERFFPSLRTFWQDDKAAYYYLCLLPTYNTGPSGGGFGWGPGFIMKYAGPFDAKKKQTIAHETSHTWIGQQLQLGSGSFANQWFGEGFNDYVALTTLAASGVFGPQEFLNYLNNNTLTTHYNSPVRGIPNDSIAAHYWQDPQYQRLPYRRGLLYAFYLDNQLRLASAGRHTLRDLLLALYALHQETQRRQPKANLTVEDFINVAGRFLPRAQVAQEVEKYMLQGQPLDFTHIPLIPAFRITGQPTPVLQLSQPATLLECYHW